MTDVASSRNTREALGRVVHARHLGLLAVAIIFLGVAIAVWGRNTLVLPGDNETLPLAILAPVPYACVVTLAVRSSMADFEQVAALRVNVVDLVCVAVLLGVACATATVALLAGDAAQLTSLVLRNIVFWTGFGCFSAAVFGRSLGWVLPVLLLVPLYESGKAGMGGQVPWWAIARHPEESVWAWAMTIVVLAFGLAAVFETSVWRRGMLGRLGRIRERHSR
ncbi:hypothetical protein [Streptosporangium sp. V21-05]|uniref:hypothetical protein n=1 Tax=Streptosporangium sp. V21-05 TaxID=3446115 RepID=UPI003F52A610